MARPEKEAAVQEVAEILEKARGVFVTDFQGLNVEKISVLRKKCRESNVHYRVIKNTLAKRAAEKAGCEEMISHFQGPSALAYSYDDPSAPARVISEFAKTEEKPKIKVTLFEGIFYGPEKVEMIATLPSREELLGRLVGGMMGPVRGLVSGLHGLMVKLVMTFDALREAREKQAE